MASDFETAVDYGLQLSKRIYYGKEPIPLPPQLQEMLKSPPPKSLLPTAVTLYAVVPEPEAVDNPDFPSYQPYVHGRCEPPALIPLHMRGPVALEIDCWLDHANVTVSGSWRVHCIKAGRWCACRVAVPLGEQGSVLGVEVDLPGTSYRSQLVAPEDVKDQEKVRKEGEGRYLKGRICTFKIPQVESGSIISVKVTWSQKLTYSEGDFCLHVPFNFPAYVNPIGKKISKREKILLNVYSGTDREVELNGCSHALKEIRREVGRFGFFYEAEVPHWSAADFKFSYTVSLPEICGGVLSQSQFLRDSDDKMMFCFYLFPGNSQSRKAFRKEVVFLIDISKSMRGAPLEGVKNALLSFLSKLNPQDSFNIIAFNGEAYLFSSLMEPATQGQILKATEWLQDNLIADGVTNILLPLQQALKLLADSTNSIPLVFLITDGTVDDERNICNFVQDSLTRRSICPRICTFGIGTYCNHYFLQTLSQIGRGQFDSAHDADSIDFRLQRFFVYASSMVVANITIDNLEHLDSFELLPSSIPDLSSRCPLIVSGRYTGKLPESVRIKGILSDMSNFTMDLKVRRAKELPLQKVLARREIDAETANAWFLDSKDIEQKIVKKSIQTGVPSEFTCMILLPTEEAEKAVKAPETMSIQEIYNKINPLKKTDSEDQKIIILGSLGVGFGNLSATVKNIPPGTDDSKLPNATEILVKAASNCCGRVLDRCWCCMYFIKTCSYTSNQCSIALSQLCGALACFGCVDCCYDLCQCV